MIVTIAEQFSSDPNDRERSPTIIWKPGLCVLQSARSQWLYGNQTSAIVMITAIEGNWNSNGDQLCSIAC